MLNSEFYLIENNSERIALESKDKTVNLQVLRVRQEGLVIDSVLGKHCYGTSFTALSGQSTPNFLTVNFWLVVLGAAVSCPSSWLYFLRF